jgi:DNA/RNA endonuclease YhcR with UshA esterase domain
MLIRLFIAILALLLCVIMAHADKAIVIKDSEAMEFVGREVEVHGRVVSVTTSPVGTAFINFGGEYPNQKFAGYIAAGSKVVSRKRLSSLSGKTVSIAGTIELYQGKPEIHIIRVDQIKVLDSQTEPGRISL